MSSTALNLVLDSPNDAADYIEALQARIEALEAALREIVEISPILSEIERIARAALEPEK